jgi:hypothetical protein
MLAHNSYFQDTIVGKDDVVFVSTWPNKVVLESQKSLFKHLN